MCTVRINVKIEKISSMNFNVLQIEKRPPLLSMVEQQCPGGIYFQCFNCSHPDVF